MRKSDKMSRPGYMVVDPGPMSEPSQIVRLVDLDNLPEYVTVSGVRFHRVELRPRYYTKAKHSEALRDAARRIVRDVGAPGGVHGAELAALSPAERAHIREMRRDARKRYAKLLGK